MNAASSRMSPREALELIWFDAEAVPRTRRHPAWRSILEALDDAPSDPRVDDAALDGDAMDVEGHRDAFELLTRAEAYPCTAPDDLLRASTRTARRVVPPLALFAGWLCFPFDPLEELKATIGAAMPFASNDGALGAAIAFARAPHAGSSPDVARALGRNVTDTFRNGARAVSDEYLAEQRTRALLESRSYQRGRVFGGDHIRALLCSSPRTSGTAGTPRTPGIAGTPRTPGIAGTPRTPGTRDGVPAYLPAVLAEDLPMFERFAVRLIATVEPAASEFESCATALRVVALGRILQGDAG